MIKIVLLKYDNLPTDNIVSIKDKYIGVKKDSNINKRVFSLPKICNGIDMADDAFTYRLQISPVNVEEATYYQPLDKNITEKSIELTWLINKINCKDNGDLHVSVLAHNEAEDIIWQSQLLTFVVSAGIDGLESVEEIPANIMEQYITAAAQHAQIAKLDAEKVTGIYELIKDALPEIDNIPVAPLASPMTIPLSVSNPPDADIAELIIRCNDLEQIIQTQQNQINKKLEIKNIYGGNNITTFEHDGNVIISVMPQDNSFIYECTGVNDNTNIESIVNDFYNSETKTTMKLQIHGVMGFGETTGEQYMHIHSDNERGAICHLDFSNCEIPSITKFLYYFLKITGNVKLHISGLSTKQINRNVENFIFVDRNNEFVTFSNCNIEVVGTAFALSECDMVSFINCMLKSELSHAVYSNNNEDIYFTNCKLFGFNKCIESNNERFFLVNSKCKIFDN